MLLIINWILENKILKNIIETYTSVILFGLSWQNNRRLMFACNT